MSVALHGNLRDFGIGEVFQLIGQQRKTGLLEIDGDSDTICVLFSEGAVVSAAAAGPGEHAALGDLLVRTGLLNKERLDAVEREAAKSGESFQSLLVQRTDLSVDQVQEIQELLNKETIFHLLRWRSGSFHFRPQTVQVGHELRLLPAEEILMDGLRMLDEWCTLDADAIDDAVVFRQSGELETYDQWAASDSAERKAAAARLFRSIDGRRSVRRLADFSREGTFETARLLTGLRRAGVIEVVDPTSLNRALPQGGSVAEITRQVAARGGAVAPFLLLVLFAFLVGRGPEPTAVENQIELRRDPGAAARVEFVSARLRHLAEVHRLATGQWPRHPDDLVRKGWIDPDVLAAAGSGPYHWDLDGETLFVLAPERWSRGDPGR